MTTIPSVESTLYTREVQVGTYSFTLLVSVHADAPNGGQPIFAFKPGTAVLNSSEASFIGGRDGYEDSGGPAALESLLWTPVEPSAEEEDMCAWTGTFDVAEAGTMIVTGWAGGEPDALKAGFYLSANLV